MGWHFRKSISVGPFRFTLTTRGISVSIGAKGFRTGINSQGRKYTSMTIPGTGWRYHKSKKIK
ncbi:MAG: DUF4236 domain-containing protein [Planctomycetota bacterium]|nr:DUF4236 domain-containing protein [Planctomycetota bacterium]